MAKILGALRGRGWAAPASPPLIPLRRDASVEEVLDATVDADPAALPSWLHRL
jgi:hypothetical protein